MESLILFLPFLLIMGGFMYFASRRQRRAMQATIELHESLRPGTGCTPRPGCRPPSSG